MSDYIIPSELGLDKDDFIFEILEKSDIIDEATFRPRQKLKVKINNSITSLNIPYMDDLNYLKSWGYSQKDIDRLEKERIEQIKFEAMLKYVNTKQFKRKLKLEKINQLNGN